MSSVAYKCIRRAVNLLAFLLLIESLVIIVYSFWSGILSRLEVYIMSNNAGLATVSNYLVSFSLFLSMVASTAVNSKSKFTINIAIIFGLFYFLFSLGCFIYVKFSYKSKLTDAVFFLSTKNSTNMSTIISMIGPNGPVFTNAESEIDYIIKTIDKELSIFQIILTCSYSISGAMTIFMVLGNNCKISKPKKKPIEEEVEVVTRTVGFSGKSLRRPQENSLVK